MGQNNITVVSGWGSNSPSTASTLRSTTPVNVSSTNSATVVAKAQASVTPTTTPSFFSSAGQSAAIQRVVDTFGLIAQRTSDIFTGQNTIKIPDNPTLQDKFTNIIASPQMLFGAPAAYAVAAPLIGSAFGATSAAGVGIGSASTAGISATSALRNPIIAGLAGLGVGSLVGGLSGGKATSSTAPQSQYPSIFNQPDTKPTQTTTPAQNNNLNFTQNWKGGATTIYQSGSGTISTDSSLRGNPSVNASPMQNTNPIQTTPVNIPSTQNTTAGQTSNASTDSSTIMYVLLGLGAVYLLRK